MKYHRLVRNNIQTKSSAGIQIAFGSSAVGAHVRIGDIKLITRINLLRRAAVEQNLPDGSSRYPADWPQNHIVKKTV